MLQVEHLKVQIQDQQGQNFLAINDISFSIEQGQSVALVGASGCGKTITALSILNLLPPYAKIISGKIFFEKKDLLSLSSQAIQAIRGKKISMIFQETGSALNPVLTCGQQMSQVLQLHFPDLSQQEISERTLKAFARVGLPDPENIKGLRAHELSGGMRQRVVIAMALAPEPKLLIADEPTAALDVTLKVQIVDLIKTIQQQNKTSLLWITHDLALATEVCERIMVMSEGQIVENKKTADLLTRS